jgi:hypothetical protein
MSTLHFTNGDSAVASMRAGGIGGEIIPWRDVLHEGPVPQGLSLGELSKVRAKWLAENGLGAVERIESELSDRNDMLRRYTDFDELVLWFEWDLYDQLQLIQILDFLAGSSTDVTQTRLFIVSHEGYLGNLDPERFAELYETRREITDDMLQSGRHAWQAFTSNDPRELERLARGGSMELEFLELSLWRHLEEFPSMRNGLSRSESQILEAVSQGPRSFHEIFKLAAMREERIFCGDAIMALYIERMSLVDTPLISYTSGERIDAPRTEEDSRAFRNAEMALSAAGREVLRYDRDWIEMGGSDRWLGGVHLEGSRTQWRWDPDERHIVTAKEANA